MTTHPAQTASDPETENELRLELAEALAEAERLRNDLATTDTGRLILDLRHQLLIARDHAIGCEAAAGTAQAEVRVLRRTLADARKEIQWMRDSWRWRIGSYAVAPIRALKQAAK